jgi:hypothetical protein
MTMATAAKGRLAPAVLAEQVHARALQASGAYKKAVADLVGVFQAAEEHCVFLERGHASLFRYATDELGLGESTSYDLIRVARKAREVPALHGCLRDGKLTLTKARRVSAVLTKANQIEWLEKACSLTSRKLEKEIARVRPGESTPERATYVTAGWVKLELGMPEKGVMRLRRAQDVLCQARRRPVSLEETISLMTEEFLTRHDPMEKAKRQQVKKGLLGTGSVPGLAGAGSVPGRLGTGQAQAQLGTGQRTPTPTRLKHAIALRDERRCTEILPNGARCNESRWIEHHHIKLIGQGGLHSLENLTTLCSAHHKRRHK